MLVFLQSNVLAKVVAFFYDVMLETTAQCVRDKKYKERWKYLNFPFIFTSTVNDVRRKLFTVRIHLTVRKRAKRMPDATVETTTYGCRILPFVLPSLTFN